MENEITAHKAGKVAELPIEGGRLRQTGDTSPSSSRPSDRDLDTTIHELADWLRIPSVSTGGGNPGAARRGRVGAAPDPRGRRHVRPGRATGHPPLVVGELRRRARAPTVLIYGHYDVQDAGDESRWTTPAVRARHPQRAHLRPRRVRRQGQLPPAAAGRLRAGRRRRAGRQRPRPDRGRGGDHRGHRRALDGGRRARRRRGDVFDAGMLDAATPALTVGTRGIVWAELVVRTGELPAHSGEFGGAALNAIHVAPPAARRRAAGRPAARRSRCAPGSSRRQPRELAAWGELPPGDRLLAEAGARPADARAAAELHVRTMAGLAGRAPDHGGRAADDRARARLGEPVGAARRGPAQRRDRRGARATAARRAPAGADLELGLHGAEPRASIPPTRAAAARRAIERATGTAPVVIRSGGSIPVLARSPTADPDDRRRLRASRRPHPRAGRELPVESLELGLKAARALYEELAALA